MLEDHLTREQVEKIEEELNAENKIEAIKIFRDFTGLGLKESKDNIEDHINHLIERDPDKYGHLLSQGRSGCFAVFIIFLGSAPGLLSLIIG